jgi:hypothetical protein
MRFELKKLKQPIDLGFIEITETYVEKKDKNENNYHFADVSNMLVPANRRIPELLYLGTNRGLR